MRKSNTQVVYLDETMFTFSTFRSKGWAHNKDGIRINDSNLRVTTLAVIAVISEEHGIIDYIVHPKAINSKVFIAFINQIAEKLGGGDFALFLDNLSNHKSKNTKHFFEKLNITKIFNVPYCPQLNGIESYFSQLKATYKKLLLKFVINDAPFDTISLINQSIKSVSNENATRCVRYTLA
jgi:transposase